MLVATVVLWSSGLTIYVMLSNLNTEFDVDRQSFIGQAVFDSLYVSRRAFIATVTITQSVLCTIILVTAYLAYQHFGWRVFKLYGSSKLMRRLVTALASEPGAGTRLEARSHPRLMTDAGPLGTHPRARVRRAPRTRYTRATRAHHAIARCAPHAAVHADALHVLDAEGRRLRDDLLLHLLMPARLRRRR